MAETPVMPADVLVLGGGPAGAAAACLLAQWGHAVRLITRPTGEARRAESLPPSCEKLFRVIGVANAIENLRCIRATGNTVWWGTDDPRVEHFPVGARGWQVERGAFDKVLLDVAAASGAAVERRAITETDLAEVADIADEARKPRQEGGPCHPFVLDCTGRRGVLARVLGQRRYDRAPRTIALAAEWRQSVGGWRVPDDTHTIIESHDDGWAWSVPACEGTRQVAVMVDPQRSQLSRRASARDVYLGEIAKTSVFRALAADAVLCAGPWGFDASTYSATRYAGERWLLVGDAGTAVDPLSSAGVKKAMASAWLAAVVIHTSLTTPSMRSLALDFFDGRERDVYRGMSTMAKRWLASAATRHPQPFWADRDDDVAPEPAVSSSDEALAIRAAFDVLKNAARLKVQRSPTLSVEPRPAVAGNAIVLEPRIVTSADDAGIRYVRNVDVLALVGMAPSHRSVPDLFEAYCLHAGSVPLPDVLTALATAVARGWLVA